MDKRIQINDNGKSEIHFSEGISDYTLCGLEQDGDSELGLSIGKATENPVTCGSCLKIVKICYSLQLKKEEKDLIKNA